MKKLFFIVLFVSFTTTLSSQVNEAGLFFGGSNFIGDIGQTYYVNPNKVATGLIYKWNWNPRVALRGTLSYIPISGDDADANNSARTNRGLFFKNNIKQAAVGIEFNFYEYDITSKEKYWTPYILVEFSAFNYDVLREDNPASYTDKTSYTIPFGFGIKSRLNQKFVVALETRFNYAFDDGLDYENEEFTLETSPSTIRNSVGNGNDWFVFTGISLSYTFGRPACYKKGL